MKENEFVMAIDQGTTSSRTILFDHQYSIKSMSQIDLTQYFPSSGWVEHSPDEIWQSTVETAKQAMRNRDIDASQVTSLGITNQRETTIIWNKRTSKPIYNAIVWQDRRTSDYCNALKNQGLEKTITEKTGLLLDPYFSASKIAWILDNVDGAKSAAKNGELAFGNVDSWLIWNLTSGEKHLTDITNASRTMLFNIARQDWDYELLDMFEIPDTMLPEVKDCSYEFGITTPSLFSSPISICGVAGDQQAAALGQACFAPGMLKATYGTGGFALLNTGSDIARSTRRLLSTIAYRINGETTFALEGSIFCAGASVKWFQEKLQLIRSPEDIGSLASNSDLNQEVYMVPAFTGLGAPWWDADARAAFSGMTLDSGPKELARAILESVCYQTYDLLLAMRSDWQNDFETILRVDGGMASSDWTMQCLSDILQTQIDRPVVIETSALGAAWLAASTVGAWPKKEDFQQNWLCQKTFSPKMPIDRRDTKVAGWNDAIKRVLSQ